MYAYPFGGGTRHGHLQRPFPHTSVRPRSSPGPLSEPRFPSFSDATAQTDSSSSGSLTSAGRVPSRTSSSTHCSTPFGAYSEAAGVMQLLLIKFIYHRRIESLSGKLSGTTLQEGLVDDFDVPSSWHGRIFTANQSINQSIDGMASATAPHLARTSSEESSASILLTWRSSTTTSPTSCR